jgi:TatD DNase family protein
MGWANEAIRALARGETITIRPRGRSMRGRVEDGQAVLLEPLRGRTPAVDDVVLVRVAGNVFLHRVVEVSKGRFLIGNNIGGINGWTDAARIYGLAVEVEGRAMSHGEKAEPVELIDIGVNLAHRSFARDREAVIDRAIAAGVRRLVITGTSPATSREAAQLARLRPGVLWSTAGVHPHHAKDCGPNTLDDLAALAARPEVVAIGETGLDFNRNFSPPAVQEQWFEAQVELAVRLDKPLFLHERDASERFGAILERHRSKLSRAVVHCFTGTERELERYLALDLHIGITGWICDPKRGAHLLGLMPKIPLERLMLETDAPFLLPKSRPAPPHDKRNEPAFLPEVLATVARALRRPEAEIAAATTETARRFFALPTERP